MTPYSLVYVYRGYTSDPEMEISLYSEGSVTYVTTLHRRSQDCNFHLSGYPTGIDMRLILMRVTCHAHLFVLDLVFVIIFSEA
jgi:hypothetical protein